MNKDGLSQKEVGVLDLNAHPDLEKFCTFEQLGELSDEEKLELVQRMRNELGI